MVTSLINVNGLRSIASEVGLSSDMLYLISNSNSINREVSIMETTMSLLTGFSTSSFIDSVGIISRKINMASIGNQFSITCFVKFNIPYKYMSSRNQDSLCYRDGVFNTIYTYLRMCSFSQEDIDEFMDIVTEYVRVLLTKMRVEISYSIVNMVAVENNHLFIKQIGESYG